ncbi:MAG: ATP-binding protein [Treponema sp.]|nr:ATP-binding protein [Treponema sp.]
MAVKSTSLKEWDLQKIIEGVGQPNIKVIVYFFSPSFEKYEPHLALCKAFPAADVFGASMWGGWSSNGAVKTGITIMSLSSDEVEECYFSFQEGVKKEPINSAHRAIAELKQKTAGQMINPDEYLGLIFFDGLCLGELIIKEFTIEKDLNMAFVGGAAADEMVFKETFISANDKVSGDGLVAIILKMKTPFFFNHYVHYVPTENSFTISRVEIMQRIAWEINGEPAAEFYARQVGVNDVSKLTVEVFAKNPLGLILGDSIYIRSPNLVVDGKGLQFYCYIEAGTKVFLLKQGDIIAGTKESILGAAHFLPGIQGCMLFNCVQRHLELIEKNLINEFNDIFSQYPMIGFNTYGEELFTHHNQTLTAVFFGTLPEAGMTDPYKTKRLFHYTDSKLKSLVFDIVSRSELLNITISYLKGTMDDENPDLLSSESALANFRAIRKSLGSMIEQSNISKKDIEKMLIVYQNNVEKTGEYVFNIVDEITAQNQRLVELREEAENANRTKSSFLASMSHEIRTPMNAITGMAELLLRSGLSDEARGYAQDIKQAGNNLISIINDILDFSKIEAGKLEIIPNKYLLASLINDTINIIRTRLKEKPIRFFTNIDGNIPNCLIGDEVRLRQILLNLLSNAVKFTDKGYISLTITAQKQKFSGKDKVLLNFTIADTGKGIKPEDREKLFGEFVQVDLKRNRNLEGTGLGLVITKRLCLIMNGNISMESEYGKGSVFSVTVPQGIDRSVAPEAFAAVDDAANKKVLVYEGRLIYANSVCWSLENMGVPHTMVTTVEDFSEALFREEWTLVLSGYGLHDKIKKVMNRPKEDFPGGEKPPLALMVEWGTEAYIPKVRFVSLPVQSLSIANILNGKADIKGYSDASGVSGIIRYSFPRARMLVVDDISTNLKVAEGLLAPYRARIDTCLSGAEAIELVKHFKYDIVFMDHMMPDMDGIETTAIIREWEKDKQLHESGNEYEQVPIIALTANAVSGVREMFIEKGFDDFIAKPVDVSKLDDVINRWISKDKRERGSGKADPDEKYATFPKINGIDVKRGIGMTGGTEAGFLSVLSIFRKDAQERLRILRKSIEEEGLKSFIINVHALKSASAAIGAEEISAEAARLENAGRTGDEAYIHANMDLFMEQLSKLIEGITYALEIEKTENENFRQTGDNAEIAAILKKLEKALKTQKADIIDLMLEEISRQPLDEKTKEAVEKISDDVLMTEFDKAAATVHEIMENLK